MAKIGHLEKRVEERKELHPGEPRRSSGKGKGDGFASNWVQEDLQNNEIHCYTKEKVSKAKEAHSVPPPMVQTNHTPSNPIPTRSETCSDPSRGHEVAAPSTQPCSFGGSCSQGLEEMKLRRYDAVDNGRSKSNAETGRKLANSPVEPQDRGESTNLPGKVRKGPDKEPGYLEKHPTGARDYER